MASIAAHSDEAAMAAADEMYAARGGCCCWIEWPAVRGCEAWQRIRSADGGGCPAASRRWWARGLKHWSVGSAAAARWKAFVRRLRGRCGAGSSSSRKRGGARFGYDPMSYALNFDEGQASDDSDGEIGRRAFSTRYATPPASMDLSAAPAFVVGDDN